MDPVGGTDPKYRLPPVFTDSPSEQRAFSVERVSAPANATAPSKSTDTIDSAASSTSTHTSLDLHGREFRHPHRRNLSTTHVHRFRAFIVQPDSTVQAVATARAAASSVMRRLPAIARCSATMPAVSAAMTRRLPCPTKAISSISGQHEMTQRPA